MYPVWQKVVRLCPCSHQIIWAYAPIMIESLMSKADSAQKANLFDSLMWVYDVRHIYFPDQYTKGNGLGYKALNTMKYKNQEAAAREQAFQWFIESIDLEKTESQPAVLDTYFKLAEIMTRMKKDTSILIEAYERSTQYIDEAIVNAYKQYEKQLEKLTELDSALANNQMNKFTYDNEARVASADTARQMKLIDGYQKTLNNIESKFSPYAPCNLLEALYSKKLAESKDVAFAKKAVRTMNKKKCTDSPVFVEALEIMHHAEPGAFTAYLMGNFVLKNKEYDKAIEYFQQAISLYETNEEKVQPYYMLALVYQLKDDYSNSRRAALNLLKIKPNFGKAYILIGNLYNASAKICQGDLAYATSWVAADKYNRAIAVDSDPEVKDEARKRLNSLTYPDPNNKHMQGLKDGASYFVPCWIQESTVVR